MSMLRECWTGEEPIDTGCSLVKGRGAKLRPNVCLGRGMHKMRVVGS